MAKIYYSGDQNIEYGGVWYKLNRTDWDSYGYCSAVRVTPCSDAGAQTNAYWVEELTVNKPDTDQDLKSVLDTCGWSIDSDSGDLVCSYHADPIAKKGTTPFRLAIAESCVGYGRYDVIRSETVQIGKTAEFCGFREHAVEPDTVLRANASLENWIRKNFIRGL